MTEQPTIDQLLAREKIQPRAPRNIRHGELLSAVEKALAEPGRTDFTPRSLSRVVRVRIRRKKVWVPDQRPSDRAILWAIRVLVAERRIEG